VPGLQAGGIDGGLGLVADQAAQAGTAEHRPLEPAEAPFCRSRRSGYLIVE
jgi:hypothetical protein